jgi:hypothetical protein
MIFWDSTGMPVGPTSLCLMLEGRSPSQMSMANSVPAAPQGPACIACKPSGAARQTRGVSSSTSCSVGAVPRRYLHLRGRHLCSATGGRASRCFVCHSRRGVCDQRSWRPCQALKQRQRFDSDRTGGHVTSEGAPLAKTFGSITHSSCITAARASADSLSAAVLVACEASREDQLSAS